MPRHRYQIVVSGRLGEIGREAFADFAIERLGRNTALIGELDETGLYDTLQRIQSLGLELVSLSRTPSQSGQV